MLPRNAARGGRTLSDVGSGRISEARRTSDAWLPRGGRGGAAERRRGRGQEGRTSAGEAGVGAGVGARARAV